MRTPSTVRRRTGNSAVLGTRRGTVSSRANSMRMFRNRTVLSRDEPCSADQYYENENEEAESAPASRTLRTQDLPPPALTPDERLRVSALKKESQTVENQLKDAVSKLERIKENLKQTKAEIDSVNSELLQLQGIIDSCLLPDKKLSITAQKLSRHKELMMLINKEDRLNSDLETARKAVAEANVAQQSHTLKMDRGQAQVMERYDARKEWEYERRLVREEKMRQAAHSARSRAIRAWSAALQDPPKEPGTPARPKVPKVSLRRMRALQAGTYSRGEDAKLQAKTQDSLRQAKLFQNLLGLKNEIDRQRTVLWAEAQDREFRKERNRILKDRMRHDMIQAGKNPFLIERAVEMVKRSRIKKKTGAELTEEAMRKVAKEYVDRKLAKEKAAQQRLKWDRFWERKAREKRRQAAEQTRKYLDYDMQSPPSERLQTAILACSDELEKQKALDLFNVEMVLAEKGILLPKVNSTAPPPLSQPETLGEEFEGEADLNLTAQIPMAKGRRLSGASGRVGRRSHGSKDRRVSVEGREPGSKERRGSGQARGQGQGSGDHGRRLGSSSPWEEEEFPFPENEEFEGQGQELVIVQAELPPPEKAVIEEVRKVESRVLPPFRASPEIVVFKDFEAGKVYKKKVYVTNKTPNRIKFYFRDFVDTGTATPAPKPVRVSGPVVPTELKVIPPETPKSPKKPKSFGSGSANSGEEQSKAPAEKELPLTPPPSLEQVERLLTPAFSIPPITDIMKVDFEIPRPICPGLRHSFNLTFRPTMLGDWSGEVHFDSPAGPLTVPVKCVRRRFLPILSAPKLSFSNVIGGTGGWLSVKLKNQGGISGLVTGFQIKNPVQNSVANYVSTHEAVPDEAKLQILESKSGTAIQAVPSLVQIKEKRLEHWIQPGSIQNSIMNFLDDIQENVTEDIFAVYVKERKRGLGPGDQLTLKVHFHPPQGDQYSNALGIMFQDPDVEPVWFDVEGTTIDNPITAEPMNTNLKICSTSFNYQQPINILNGSKSSGKVFAMVPACMQAYAEMYPTEAHSFPGHPVLFSLKFRPRTGLPQHPYIEAVYDADTKIIDFPIYFFLDFPFATAGPLICTVQALLDEPSLEISPLEIDLGKVTTSETVRKRFTIKSNSILPQHFGFVDVPNYVTIQPNDGFGTILPGETQEWHVLVSPPIHTTGEHRLGLKVRTLEKRDYFLRIKLIGTENKIGLSSTHIDFPSTCVESLSSTVIDVYSTAALIKTRGHFTALSGIVHKFEFMVPKEYSSQIHFQPNAGYIEPGKRAKVLVAFEPIINEEEVRGHSQEVLEKEFERNKLNLQAELETINEILETPASPDEDEDAIAPPPEPKVPSAEQVRNFSVYPNPRTSTAPRKASQESEGPVPTGKRRKTLAQGKNHRKSSFRRKSRDSLPEHQPKKSNAGDAHIRIRTLEDLQLIWSDGRIDPADTGNLKGRRRKVIRSLMAHFDPPAGSPSLLPGSIDYEKSRRDLIQNYKARSRAVVVPCIVTAPGGDDLTLLLNLKCPSMKPDIILLNESRVLDFGTIEVRQKALREVHFYNMSEGPVDLKVDVLDPYGPFERVNALRKLAPDLVFTLKLKFRPEEHGDFEETVNVYGGESRICLYLKGIGIPSHEPVLDLGSEEEVGEVEEVIARSEPEVQDPQAVSNRKRKNSKNSRRVSVGSKDTVLNVGHKKEAGVSDGHKKEAGVSDGHKNEAGGSDAHKNEAGAASGRIKKHSGTTTASFKEATASVSLKKNL